MYSRHSIPNQEPDERIILFLRRHWIAVVKIAALVVVLAALPLVFVIYLVNYTDYLTVSEVARALFTLFLSGYYLFVILFAFANFVDYYLDVWIVTNRRIVNIEQKGLFAREVSEKDLTVMQDITSDVDGFWATLLDYGNVYIQTAGEQARFVFKEVPFAAEVAQKISNLVAEYKKLEQKKDL